MRSPGFLLALAVVLLAPLGCDGDSPTSPSDSGTLAVVPQSAGLEEGASLHLEVVGADGPVTWSSSRPLVASVDADGMVTTRNVLGTARITAAVGGAMATADVTVEPQCENPLPIDGTPPLSAEARPKIVTLAAGLDVETTAQALARELGFTIVELLPDGFRAYIDVPTVAILRCREEVAAIRYPD